MAPNSKYSTHLAHAQTKCLYALAACFFSLGRAFSHRERKWRWPCGEEGRQGGMAQWGKRRDVPRPCLVPFPHGLSREKTDCQQSTNYRYRITKSSNQTPVIGHPRDRAPITRQKGARRTNHDQEFCYRYD